MLEPCFEALATYIVFFQLFFSNPIGFLFFQYFLFLFLFSGSQNFSGNQKNSSYYKINPTKNIDPTNPGAVKKSKPTPQALKPSPKVGFFQNIGNQIGKLDNLNFVAKGWEQDARGTRAVKAFFGKSEEPTQLGPLAPQNQENFSLGEPSLPLLGEPLLPLDPPEPPKNSGDNQKNPEKETGKI